MKPTKLLIVMLLLPACASAPAQRDETLITEAPVQLASCAELKLVDIDLMFEEEMLTALACGEIELETLNAETENTNE